MADITMCSDNECPSKIACKRHTCSGTIPDNIQSYADFQRPQESHVLFCDDYMPTKRIPLMRVKK